MSLMVRIEETHQRTIGTPAVHQIGIQLKIQATKIILHLLASLNHNQVTGTAAGTNIRIICKLFQIHLSVLKTVNLTM